MSAQWNNFPLLSQDSTDPTGLKESCNKTSFSHISIKAKLLMEFDVSEFDIKD